ncbi:MAG: hypothetical protein ABUK20_15355, partial [Anaerolineales bacterium]
GNRLRSQILQERSSANYAPVPRGAGLAMVAQVPSRHVATIYTAFGRWFEWLCVAGFLFVVAWALIAGRVRE